MRSADRGWPARLFRKRHAPRPRSRRRSRGARLLVAILLEGRADEGVDQRIIVETRRRIGIPMSVIVAAADEQRAAPAERRADMGRNEEQRVADAADR